MSLEETLAQVEQKIRKLDLQRSELYAEYERKYEVIKKEKEELEQKKMT